jgi:hypothetical protein
VPETDQVFLTWKLKQKRYAHMSFNYEAWPMGKNHLAFMWIANTGTHIKKGLIIYVSFSFNQ